jgi:hypothetical protein
MDPQATLERFLVACDVFEHATVRQDDIDARADASLALADLLSWIGRDGFLPRRSEIKRPGEPKFKKGDKVRHRRHGWRGVVWHVVNDIIAVDVGNDRIRPAESPEDWARE